MASKILKDAIVLGLLMAVGPFAVDMYLPALPAIGRSLGATTGAVQMSLVAFLVTMGLGQLVCGPLSDMLGRKRPLYAGLLLYILTSMGCGLALTVRALVAFRFLQGLGACAGMVIPMAVVRDLYRGNDAARLMSRLMLVFSVSPIVSPVVGTLVVEVWGWRAIFALVTVAALLGVVLLALLLPETRPRELRRESSVASAIAGYRALLGDRNFMRLALIVAFGIASFFAYLANSAYILIEHFGLSPRQYSVVFSINAASFIGASQLTDRLGTRLGLQRVLRVGVTGFAAATTVLFALTLGGVDRLAVVTGLLFVGYGFLGLVVPATTALALDEHGEIAGTASALMATLQSVTGITVIAVVGVFLDGTSRPMAGGIAACALASLALAYRPAVRGAPRAEAEAHRTPITEPAAPPITISLTE
ncbi:MAG TPA: multidrug effflux MFS transporter [Polyangiaceae bacterium]|jgi:DHA1 family bicyclomycin/chloramphenicol resistance-like MFS transporter|nr:multidrug effflux MFS transporter [Polyangiaceae bacterium]